MKPMLEGEFQRFRMVLWLSDKVLVIVPVTIFGWAAWNEDPHLLLIASAVTLQNALALWVLKRLKE